MVDIIHRIGINAPAAKVYDALATVEGVAGWWTTDTTGDSRAGGKMSAGFYSPAGHEMGRFDWEVVELTPAQKVVWRVTDGPEEWVGTDIEFNLSQQDACTIVQFGHRNWPEQKEFMAHCSMKWATFLLSLRELVETGKGKPAPEDLKIDNWN